MKFIRISTDLEVTVHDFPNGNYDKQNAELRKYIGETCELYERVMPVRLYTRFGQSNRPTKIAGQCVSMLIDEEGLLKKDMEANLVASYLYETDKHGTPIMGNVLFVGEEMTDDGIDFCGIEESVCENLQKQLQNMAYAMLGLKEVMSR